MASANSVRHVACIMDGNGRWAMNRGLERIHGHLASMPALEAVVDAALAEGVPWLTLFALATENWSRPAGEVGFLMSTLANRIIDNSLSRFHAKGVRVRMLGALEGRLSDDMAAKIRHAEEITRDNDGLNLTMAVGYDGRDDLVHAARALAAAGIPPDDITTEVFARHLQDPDLPDVDLLIRSGGEQRLSDFPLWHCAHAELVFLDVLWPDFRAEHFRHALRIHHQRQHRFGSLAAAPAAPAGGGTIVPKVITLPGVMALHLTGGLLGTVRGTMRAAATHLGATPPDSPPR
ncbi:polyprenyl diphosphate synthase [Actinomadura syzygii]|uniref:Isoprenyl transferase n=1 Tax=Actinomadura syzygii TaxID=1427538 RepID=A0A5D0TWU0_9ACTN|nr:polyprenyl diphosphate synthase [Actinomadura syzygii]TYC09805.1 di-trans,poly-cis-decaprenylcistransferase [Actinomadura syzygii]